MKKNFILRTITGLLFVAVLAGCTIYSPITFGILFILISALTTREFVQLMNKTQAIHVNKTITMLGAAYLFLACMGFCMGAIGSEVFIPYSAILLYLFISELYMKREKPVLNWAYAMMSQLYIALPFAMLNALAFLKDTESNSVNYNHILPLSIFIFIWLNDTGAYCVGSLIGKHRLFERISPKKSWEGSIGGGLLVIASALILSNLFPFMSMEAWIGLALTVVVFATWGDLTESLLKRQLQIKDSGNFLPGHGGLLDRFDSALMAIPAAAVYIYLLSFL